MNDYYNWAMECSGVGAARIFPLADGPGTVKVVIASTNIAAADQALIEKVSDYIEKFRPIGATVSVVSAVEKEINISVKAMLSSETNLGTAQSEFQKLVDQFLRKSAFDADYVSLARIGNLLMNVAGVEDYSDLKLNGETGNIQLSDEEIAVVGTVRLEVV